MIDIHAHLLPAVDDGAENIEETISLGIAALEAGTRIMVATPHTLNGIYRNGRNEILAQVNEVKEIFKEKKIPLKLLPGADVALTPEVIPYMESGDLMTINDTGKYILAELPHYYEPPKIHKIVFRLQLHGIRPIITHPERNGMILKDVNILRDLIDRGCLAQLTAMSITGGFGRKIETFSRYLAENDLVHVIASDCHSPHNRGPSMKEAFHVLSALIGCEKAKNMVVHYSQAIIDGEPIEASPCKREAEKRSEWFWRRFVDRSY